MTSGVKIIDDFHGDNFFLDNFYPQSLVFQGETYPTSEHAFQAMKCADPEERAKFQVASHPAFAKSLGQGVKLRSDWEEVKYQVMKDIVRAKFEQHPYIREQLIATGDTELIEGNTWDDRTWGMVKDSNGVFQGKNWLGKILMELREEFKPKPTEEITNE